MEIEGNEIFIEAKGISLDGVADNLVALLKNKPEFLAVGRTENTTFTVKGIVYPGMVVWATKREHPESVVLVMGRLFNDYQHYRFEITDQVPERYYEAIIGALLL